MKYISRGVISSPRGLQSVEDDWSLDETITPSKTLHSARDDTVFLHLLMCKRYEDLQKIGVLIPIVTEEPIRQGFGKKAINKSDYSLWGG